MKEYKNVRFFVVEFTQTDIITESLTGNSTNSGASLEVIIEDIWG